MGPLCGFNFHEWLACRLLKTIIHVGKACYYYRRELWSYNHQIVRECDFNSPHQKALPPKLRNRQTNSYENVYLEIQK